MIKIKELDGNLEPTFVVGFNTYKEKLISILSKNENINKAEFFGVVHHNKEKEEYGILVIGIDSQDTEVIKRFWSCAEINQHQRQREKRKKITDTINRFEKMIK